MNTNEILDNLDAPDFQMVKPIIIRITNDSESTVSNFDVFNVKYLSEGFCGGSWSEAGNFTLREITISSQSVNISFKEILNDIQKTPFTVGAVCLECIKGSSLQITDTYCLTYESLEGKLYKMKMKPFKDPFNAEKKITYNKEIFNIEPLTILTWKTIYAMTEFQISIFSEQTINTCLALDGYKPLTLHNKPTAIRNLHGMYLRKGI